MTELTVEQLIEKFTNQEQIGATTEELHAMSDAELRLYPGYINFFKQIVDEDLDIILPENSFVGEVALRECVTPVTINGVMYVRMAIYKRKANGSLGRGFASANDEMRLWLGVLGTDGIVKILPIEE